MHETAGEQAPTRIYANRAAAFLYGVVGGGVFVFFDVLTYVTPKPEVVTHPWLYVEPVKTLFFGAWLLLCGTIVLMGLYWMLTPLPMIELNATGMMYQRLPLMRRNVRWDDVSDINAFTTSWKSYFRRVTQLILTIRLKPHAALLYQGREQLVWKFGPALLPVPLDGVVRDIERYHHVKIAKSPLGGHPPST